MKIFIWIGLFACVGLFAISIWLLYLNRSSETIWSKVIPAFVIGLIGIFFTIWFSTKSESDDTRFNYTLYFNKVDKKPLDEHYNKQHVYGGAQYDIKLRNFINTKLPEMGFNKSEFEKEGEKIIEFYFDLAFVKLISNFFAIYPESWDIYIDSTRRGNSLTRVRKVNKPELQLVTLKWNDFLDLLDPQYSLYKLLNDFSQDFWIKEMKVPPKTTVGIKTIKYKKTLSLKNPFAEIYITFNRRGGSVGLGDYQWLLGYENKKNMEFWSEHFEVVCEVKFERLRSGHPEMPRYKKWAQTMLEEVQYQFDDKKRLIRARDYRDLSRHK